MHTHAPKYVINIHTRTYTPATMYKHARTHARTHAHKQRDMSRFCISTNHNYLPGGLSSSCHILFVIYLQRMSLAHVIWTNVIQMMILMYVTSRLRTPVVCGSVVGCNEISVRQRRGANWPGRFTLEPTIDNSFELSFFG